MARIRVIAPDGRSGTIDSSELEAASQQGFRPETAADVKKRGYEDQKLRTAAEGAARSVSLGLSDPFLKGYGVPAEDIQMRREANPGSALVGELAGAALPIGAGPTVARIGSSVERAVVGEAPTVATKLLGKAAGGATSGGLWGLGASISEDALQEGDKQLAGEKLLAIGGGAMAGAGLGVIEGGLGMAGKAIYGKVVGESFRNKLSEFSEEVMMRQISQQSDFNKMNLFDRRKEIGRYALDKGWGKEAALGGVEALHSAAEKDSSQIGARMGEILNEVDTRVHGVDTSRIAVKARDILKDIERDPLMASSRNAVQSYLEELDSGPISFSKLWEMQSNIRNKIGPTEPNAFKESLWKLRRVIRDELIDQTGEVSPHFREQLLKLNREYGYSQQIEDLALKRVMQKEGNRWLGPSDYITGAAGAVAGGPLGLGAAVVNKVARERGGFVLAELGDRLSKSKIITSMAETFKRKIDQMITENPELLGAYKVPLQQAAARGAMDLLATHIQFMKHDPEYASHVGVVEESPEFATEAVQKGEGLSSVAGLLQGFDAQIGQSTERFLGRAPGRPGSVKAPAQSIKDFNERMVALQALVEQGGAHLPSLDSLAPTTASMLQLASLNAANFLIEKAPKSPFAGQMKALSRPWEPSDTALSKWYRYVEAIERPQHVMEELASGVVMPEHIEAVAAAYPKMLDHFRQQMLSRLSELEETLPYEKRLALSGFLGTDILGISSEQLQLLQGLHHTAQSPMMAGAGPKPDGRQDVDQEKNMETQSQRMEKRA